MLDGGFSLNQTTILALFGAMGGAGLVGRFWEHIFSWRKRATDEKQTLQQMVDSRLSLLIQADQERLNQMSAALENQSHLIQTLQEQTSDQSTKIDGLEHVIKQLVAHIASLERMMRLAQIEPPPRPALAVDGTRL